MPIRRFTIVTLLFIIVMVSFAGKATALQMGTYSLVREPWRKLELRDDGVFELALRIEMSYQPIGKYMFDEGVLTLFDDEGVSAVTFRSDEDSLIVDRLPPLIQKRFLLQDNDRFELVSAKDVLAGTYRSDDKKTALTLDRGLFRLQKEGQDVEEGFFYAYNNKLLLGIDFGFGRKEPAKVTVFDVNGLMLTAEATESGSLEPVSLTLDFFETERRFVNGTREIRFKMDQTWTASTGFKGTVTRQKDGIFTLKTLDKKSLTLQVNGNALLVLSADDGLSAVFSPGDSFEAKGEST